VPTTEFRVDFGRWVRRQNHAAVELEATAAGFQGQQCWKQIQFALSPAQGPRRVRRDAVECFATSLMLQIGQWHRGLDSQTGVGAVDYYLHEFTSWYQGRLPAAPASIRIGAGSVCALSPWTRPYLSAVAERFRSGDRCRHPTVSTSSDMFIESMMPPRHEHQSPQVLFFIL